MSVNTPKSIQFLNRRALLLWIVAVVFFGFGDIITTTIGLTTGWAIESGPLAAAAVSQIGLGVIIPMKLIVFGVCYALWMIVPTLYRIGIPIGLSGLGICITVWNLTVLVLAGISNIS